MQIILLVVGKTSDSWIEAGIKEYQKRLRHYANFQLLIIPELKMGKRSAEEIKRLEGVEILKIIDGSDRVVLLDEHGETHSSKKFSLRLQKWMNASPKRLVFVVGGAYGFSEDVYLRANDKLALSSMTFTHQMIRPYFIEQLYRAFTILRGEKYHNE